MKKKVSVIAAIMFLICFAILSRKNISAPGGTHVSEDNPSHLAPAGGGPEVENAGLRQTEPDRMASRILAENQVSLLIQNLIEQQTQLQKMESGLPNNPRLFASGLRLVLLTNSVRRIVLRHGSASLTESDIFALVKGELDKSH